VLLSLIFFLIIIFISIIAFLHLWPVWRGPNKKPTTVASRGFLSKSGSISTRADGVADYDDCQNNNLPNDSKHRGEIYRLVKGGSSPVLQRFSAR